MEKKEIIDQTIENRLYMVGGNKLATRSDIGGIIASTNLTFMVAEKVKPDELDKIQERTVEYFSHCEKFNNLPTMQGLAGWLGINRKTLYEWLKDSRRPQTVDLLERIRDIIADISTQAASKGKINPVTWIFYAKNYFEMQDSVDINVGATNNSLMPTKSEAELMKEYSANDLLEE